MADPLSISCTAFQGSRQLISGPFVEVVLAVKEAVDRLLSQGRTQVVLNLARLSYMDSSGLGEIIACYSATVKAGGTIKLANTTTRIQDLLSITKLITVFDTYDSEARALESFSPVAVAAVTPAPRG